MPLNAQACAISGADDIFVSPPISTGDLSGNICIIGREISGPLIPPTFPFLLETLYYRVSDYSNNQR